MAKSEGVERLTWTIPELASALGISTRTAWAMLRDGQIEGVVRIGRRVLVLRQAVVDQLLRGAGIDPDADAPDFAADDAAAATATARENAAAAERRKALVAAGGSWM